MIIKISDDGLSVRWSHDSTMNTQNWQHADIDDLINAYEKNIIRCKDCINGECNHIGMKGTSIGVSVETWFCADGERKEDAE